MRVRFAEAADAEEAASVLRRSIRELCVPDHRGVEAAIVAWLANKTADNLRFWITIPEDCVVVAEEDGVILGVAAASFSGEIKLNYVAPEARFKGVSKAMLAFIEELLSARGQARCTLTSTITAHAFYRAAGYIDSPEAGADGRRTMAKSLQYGRTTLTRRD